MSTIEILWTVLLVAVVALLPFVVGGLHRIWRASRNIDRYLEAMLEAGVGIAGNTVEIRQLDATIDTASAMLEVAGSIHGRAQTLGSTLAQRANAGG